MIGGRHTEKQLAALLERQRTAGRVRSVISEDGPTKSVARRVALRKAPKPFKLSERMVLSACLDLLDASPKVAFAWRQNTGAVKIAKRFVRFGFKGCSDILGMLTDGRFFAVETKETGEVATADQAAFLANVIKHGGFAICVDHPKLLEAALAKL
jgi:hypothetical protein